MLNRLPRLSDALPLSNAPKLLQFKNTSTVLKKYVRQLHRDFIEPNSVDPTERHQESVFNILTFSLALIGMVILGITFVELFSDNSTQVTGSYTIALTFYLTILGILALSRKGYYRLAANIFLGLFALAVMLLLFHWGLMLQSVLLLFIIVLIIASYILNARTILVYTGIATLLVILVSYLQKEGTWLPHADWFSEPFRIGDVIGNVAIFLVIGLGTWFSNRKVKSALQRAQASEKALAAERDSLEAKIILRTRELEKEQLHGLMELRRFAEFGRLSANLLHEVANPLTAASLNLEQFDEGQHSSLVFQARKNLQHLERYVEAARKQIKGNGVISTFSVRSEINQVISLLSMRANTNGCDIKLRQDGQLKLYGDSVKFSQLIANLLSNAIDAYHGSDRSPFDRQIDITISREGKWLRCSVHNWGNIIPPDHLSHIFDPFFTTKINSDRNMGIGLYMVKQFVENDFHGEITVISSETVGTTFEVTLRDQIRVNKKPSKRPPTKKRLSPLEPAR